MDQEIKPANTSEEKKDESAHSDVQDILENDLSCAICRDIYINPLILNCSHSFCKFCVYRWLSSRTVCPECRMTVSFQAENLALRNIINKMVLKSSPQFQKNRTNNVNQRLKDEEEQKQDGTLSRVIKYDAGDRENQRSSRGSVLQNVFPNELGQHRRESGDDVVGIQWYSVPRYNARRNRLFFEQAARGDPRSASMNESDEDDADEESGDDDDDYEDRGPSDSEEGSDGDVVLGDAFETDSDASETPTDTDESDLDTSDAEMMAANWSTASNSDDDDMIWVPGNESDDDVDDIDWSIILDELSAPTSENSSSSDEVESSSANSTNSDSSLEYMEDPDRYSDDSTIAYGTSDDSDASLGFDIDDAGEPHFQDDDQNDDILW